MQQVVRVGLFGCMFGLIACGSSPPSTPDGSGGVPDAAPCVNDRDGDGVCDEVDLCPDIADPGQTDFDGDHISWMCDPVETVTLASSGSSPNFTASIHGNTFAAIGRSFCEADPCGHDLVQVGPAGGIHVRSDSTAPADAWQAVPWLGGPIVTDEERVLWSRGRYVGDTGDLDLASGVFTPRMGAVFLENLQQGTSSLYAGKSLVGLELRADPDGLTKHFVEVRADGSLPIVETAQGFEIISDHVQGGIPIPGPTPRALMPLRVQFKYRLKLYTEGVPSLAEILVEGTPLADLSQLQPILVDGYPRGFCAMRGGQAYDIQWNAAGEVVSYRLPHATCHRLTATDRGAVRIFSSDGSLAPSATAYLYNGVMHTLMVGEGPASKILGAQLPVVLSTYNKVWRIAADGTSSVLASGISSTIVSMAGDTVHVLSHHPYDQSGLGTWELARYRPNTPPATVQVFTNSYNGIGLSMFSTAEGAALISYGSFTHENVVVPSQAMTPMPVALGELSGGVRNGRTIVFGNSYGGLKPGALYLYDEVAGMPRFTQIAATSMYSQGKLIDSPDRSGSTSWFAYGNAITGYYLARITSAGTLEQIPSGQPLAVSALGTRADGALLARDGRHVFALTDSGGSSIGVGATAAILDTLQSPPAVVGWTASTADNTRWFACLAAHPDRCWDYLPATVAVTRADAFANGGAGSFSLILRRSAPPFDSVGFTVVRSFGPGNFTPPPPPPPL